MAFDKKAYHKKYRRIHKEKISIQRKERYQLHKEQEKAQQKIYREKNREKIRAQQREYRLKPESKRKYWEWLKKESERKILYDDGGINEIGTNIHNAIKKTLLQEFDKKFGVGKRV